MNEICSEGSCKQLIPTSAILKVSIRFHCSCRSCVIGSDSCQYEYWSWNPECDVKIYLKFNTQIDQMFSNNISVNIPPFTKDYREYPKAPATKMS